MSLFPPFCELSYISYIGGNTCGVRNKEFVYNLFFQKPYHIFTNVQDFLFWLELISHLLTHKKYSFTTIKADILSQVMATIDEYTPRSLAKVSYHFQYMTFPWKIINKSYSFACLGNLLVSENLPSHVLYIHRKNYQIKSFHKVTKAYIVCVIKRLIWTE